MSSSDPYAVVSCAGVEAKTRTIKQQLEPKWEETLMLVMSSFEAAVTSGIDVAVYDWDRFTADDLLGSVHVEIGVLKTQPHETYVVELDTKGRIFFEVRGARACGGHAIPTLPHTPTCGHACPSTRIQTLCH